MNSDYCDYIVIGSGIAGLRAAMELVQTGSVRVYCKGDPWQSNTRWAQGGIAAAMQEGDTVEFHLQDTLKAGDGLCYEPAVRVLVEEGPQRIQELVAWGAEFDSIEGKFVFGREGAHTRNRILHSGDATGKEILRALMNWVEQTKKIELIPYSPAVDLILDREGRCAGIITMDENTGKMTEVYAQGVLLATGGAGQIYSHTTNPLVATGDGAAIAYRAGAEMMDLEFFQFHPTAFHYHGAPRFLLTEALRGEGAMLKNMHGKAFMKSHHEMGDLAPRDIVSRAIVSEIRKTESSWVYLDATSIKRKKLRERFPNIYEFLENYQLDLAIDLIPVSPSAHYWMGGVKTDLFGLTSIPGLYAAGEVACTGVHGANRLASNSLLEGLVFGARAGEVMTKQDRIQHASGSSRKAPTLSGKVPGDLHLLRKRIQEHNWKQLGLIRSARGIKELLDFLNPIEEFPPSNLTELELLNLLQCSKLMGASALKREESRGSHYREDFPEKKTEWNDCHSIVRNGQIEITKI